MNFLEKLRQKFKKTSPTADSLVQAPQIKPNENPNEYWQSVKDFAMAGLSVATGDPEAMKTLVDVLANATYQGLEHIDVKDDKKKQEIKIKLENAINEGADGLMKAFTKFQQAAQSSNKNMRAKYGRNRQVV